MAENTTYKSDLNLFQVCQGRGHSLCAGGLRLFVIQAGRLSTFQGFHDLPRLLLDAAISWGRKPA